MNVCRILSFLALLLLTSSISFGEPRCPADVTPVHYHSLNNSQLTIPVTVNGLGPYEFMVDTGAQVSAVDPSLAAELRLEYYGYVGVHFFNRYSKVDLETARSVQTGPYVVRNALVLVQGLEQIHDYFPAVRGILGQTFLAHFDLLIDRAHKLLCLDEAGHLQKELQGERLPILQVARESDMPFTQPILISAKVTGTGQRNTILRLDSGSNSPLLYANLLAEPPWIQKKHAVQSAMPGRTALYVIRTEPRDVQLGKKILRGVEFSTLVNDQASVKVPGEDGVLPIGLFKDVFISHTDHYVIFNSRRVPAH